jgi:N-acylneuraminate cytidylyltransferase
MKTKNVAIILARGGSKGIPGKNWIDFCSMPLFYWSIFAALEDDACDDVIVSSDSLAVKKLCDDLENEKITFVERPTNISGDNSPSEEAIDHALNKTGRSINDNVIFLQPTSPFRHSGLIRNCIAKCSQGQSVFTATAHTPLFWSCDKSGYFYKRYAHRKMRQEYLDEELMWHDCGNVYAFTVKDFDREKNRHCGIANAIKADCIHAMQIDSKIDLDVCRKVSQTEVVQSWMSKIAKLSQK